MLPERIDYHCHLLPGIDDGARNLEEALAMARLLAAAGFVSVHCTPHRIRGLYDTAPEMVRSRVAELQSELTRGGIELQLRAGMEYYLDEYFPAALEDPLPLGDSRLLLVEAPPNAHPLMVQENIFLAVRKGFVPLFAHPERVSFLAPDEKRRGFLGLFKGQGFAAHSIAGNSRLETLRQQGCRFQGNLGSFAGYYGRDVQRRAKFFQQTGLYDCFGSDGHRPEPLTWILDKTKDLIF
ncbi:MAG: CpsB/CapC family capsule biosynthesis tyrosine phosphatase [Desulfuromonadales bacterium]|nr:CpsB/CapC family capsule biosynthesis tyrosine phosphatase [Desulfuromonadales bacterium]